MAYQALTQGYSRCVSLQAMPFSDAHNGGYWRNLHRWHLLGGFNQVAALAAELEATPYPTGGTWLDKTTIVCCSEFNRSPFKPNGEDEIMRLQTLVYCWAELLE